MIYIPNIADASGRLLVSKPQPVLPKLAPDDQTCLSMPECQVNFSAVCPVVCVDYAPPSAKTSLETFRDDGDATDRRLDSPAKETYLGGARDHTDSTRQRPADRQRHSL